MLSVQAPAASAAGAFVAKLNILFNAKCHLDEDPRGPVRVHDRSRIREVAEQRIRSHPLWPS